MGTHTLLLRLVSVYQIKQKPVGNALVYINLRVSISTKFSNLPFLFFLSKNFFPSPAVD